MSQDIIADRPALGSAETTMHILLIPNHSSRCDRKTACPEPLETYPAISIWYRVAGFTSAAFVSARRIADGSPTSAVIAAAIPCMAKAWIETFPTSPEKVTYYMQVEDRTISCFTPEQIRSTYTTSLPLASKPAERGTVQGA